MYVVYVKDVETELLVQVSMKQEMEMAMKLLEKDIHEKQVSTLSSFLRTDLFTKYLELKVEQMYTEEKTLK